MSCSERTFSFRIALMFWGSSVKTTLSPIIRSSTVRPYWWRSIWVKLRNLSEVSAFEHLYARSSPGTQANQHCNQHWITTPPCCPLPNGAQCGIIKAVVPSRRTFLSWKSEHKVEAIYETTINARAVERYPKQLESEQLERKQTKILLAISKKRNTEYTVNGNTINSSSRSWWAYLRDLWLHMRQAWFVLAAAGRKWEY